MNHEQNPCGRSRVVEKRARFSIAAIQREILSENNIDERFTLIETPAPARDQTLFKAYTDGRTLLIAVAVFESVGPTTRHGADEIPNRNTIEIFFAPWNDRLGWFQFCFPPDGSSATFNHLPYPEAHATSFEHTRLAGFEWVTDTRHPSVRMHWLFARFPLAQVFRAGPTCGFNVTRSSPAIEELSAWNHVAGVNFQDATIFGALHLRRPRAAAPAPPAPRAPTRKQVRDFRFSVTYDIPDNVAYTNYYSPERLERELTLWKEWGIQRVFWIEYGPISAWPSFWKVMIGAHQHASSAANVARTRRYCDDMLPLAARLSRRLGMECIAVYKPFDLGFNTEWMERDGVSTVAEIENRHVCAHPDVASHQDCTMSAHPDWTRRAAFPIRRLCLYSQEPLGRFAAKDVRLWVSADNRRYSLYRKPFRVARGPVRRPHLRWTPAGAVPAPGSARNWRIELSGLALDAPYLAIEIHGKTFAMTHRRFALVEAWGADGAAAPVSLATAGDRARGYRFDKVWLGWANHTEPLLDVFDWRGAELGLVFKEMERAPTLLEPAYEGSRAVWLSHVHRMLDAGVDGVEIRTIGHHNCFGSYLRLAFAEPVRAEFRRRHGREVEATPADYERVRRIRGEAYTQFIRDAHALAHRRGKMLSAHVESGAEVPPHLDTRLQMQMVVEWERWLREGIVDGLSLRGWGCYNPFVRERLLPLARRKKVPVHLISRNLPGGLDLRAMEVCERYVTQACAAGFSGFSLYETDSLMKLNAAGIPKCVGNVEEAVRRARRALDRLA